MVRRREEPAREARREQREDPEDEGAQRHPHGHAVWTPVRAAGTVRIQMSQTISTSSMMSACHR